MKWRWECIKFRAYFRYKLKKSLLPEKYYLLTFILISFFTAPLILKLVGIIPGPLSINPPGLEWWRFIKIILALFLFLHGIYVRHKGEKVVFLAWTSTFMINIFAQFIRDKGIYSFLEVSQYVIAIACGLVFLFLIAEKKIRTSRRKGN